MDRYASIPLPLTKFNMMMSCGASGLHMQSRPGYLPGLLCCQQDLSTVNTLERRSSRKFYLSSTMVGHMSTPHPSFSGSREWSSTIDLGTRWQSSALSVSQ
jgi:hypothetical protein